MGRDDMAEDCITLTARIGRRAKVVFARYLLTKALVVN